jgi:tripartite-type tricarboxylate transporter receptor subunit TctC
MAAWAVGAAAADYPTKPINLYIGSTPAGSTDVLGRVLAKSLEDVLGQPVVVQNRVGAGGGVMATRLLTSPPDGYTLGMAISQAYSGNPIMLPTATKYDVGDFTHLASVSKGQCALVTSTEKPYRTLNDVVEAAKHGAEPVYASQSPLTRIVADYIAKVAGVKFKVITVQGGGEMMQAILGGHADFGFSGGPHVDFVAAGKMRVLASTEGERLATSPDVPTLRELGYDITSCSLFVVSAPPNLPADIESTLAPALKAAIESPQMRALIKSLKYPEYYLGPDQVTQALKAEADTLARAVARINE